MPNKRYPLSSGILPHFFGIAEEDIPGLTRAGQVAESVVMAPYRAAWKALGIDKPKKRKKKAKRKE